MLIIGVAGGTGSGKTTLVQKVMANFPQGSIGLIAQDAYYNDNSALSFEERCTINYDHPSAIDFELLTSHLKTLKNGQGIAQPTTGLTKPNGPRLQKSLL
jgi:uridine kinase